MQHPDYPFDSLDAQLDSECVSLCEAINRLPHVYTVESCCGHGRDPYMIWCRVDSLEGMQLLGRLTCRRHGCSTVLEFVVDHGTCDYEPGVAWVILRGPPGKASYEAAQQLADHIKSKMKGVLPPEHTDTSPHDAAYFDSLSADES